MTEFKDILLREIAGGKRTRPQDFTLTQLADLDVATALEGRWKVPLLQAARRNIQPQWVPVLNIPPQFAAPGAHPISGADIGEAAKPRVVGGEYNKVINDIKDCGLECELVTFIMPDRRSVYLVMVKLPKE